ncbi:MAG: mechanosensitive ion channel [Gemmatimonadetes bacterium]|nr:MAG: mechanosensitive ion channel [Gemmatimonadota bacterium]
MNQAPPDTTAASAVTTVADWLNAHPTVATALALTAMILLAWLMDVVAKQRILAAISLIVKRTKFAWDDALLEHRVFERFGRVVPALVIYFVIPVVPGVGPEAEAFIRHVAAAFMVAVVVLAIGALLTAVNDIYERFEMAAHRPIKGYLQVGKIAVYVLGAVVVLATLMNRSPLIFLSGIGAMTAVLMLVFKDTLLSLVASIQLMSNDMVRVGDWIEMPKYNADGDVIDIALHTVKIQNWDNTITTVPTSKFIEDSFKNWRGMSESGGRRIKRSIWIDKGTIRFLSDEEITRFKRFALLRDYIEQKQKELRDYNEALGGEPGDVNMRRLTNIGTFRAYILNYLKNHPKIHQEKTLMVRQLAPTPHGIPLEVYVFTNDTAWSVYEGIQADIFEHVMALVPEFGLRLFQNPTGADFKKVFSSETPAGA